MLTSFRCRNFKCWADTGEVQLAPLVGFFGPNSSGKTALLQFLLMLKQTTESPDRTQVLHLGDRNSLVELGTYRDIIFRHDSRSDLRWLLRWTLPQTLRCKDPESTGDIFSTDDISLDTQIRWKEEDHYLRPQVEQVKYTVEGGHSFGIRIRSNGYSSGNSRDKRAYTLFTENTGRFRFKRSRGRKWPLPPPAKFYGFPDETWNYYQNASFLADFQLQVEEFFRRVYYLGPLREYPQRRYLWAGERPLDVGPRGEQAIAAILASRQANELIRRGQGRRKLTLEEMIALCLEQLGLGRHFEIRPLAERGNIFQAWIKTTADAPNTLIADVGFGVSQILPVLALCYYVPAGLIIILEQPEIHLHPKAQTELADVLIDAILTRDIQLIIESHSEHLLRRIQRRVADGKLSKDKVALYFCQIQKDKARLNQLKLNDCGQIENWPPDFFGDPLEDIIHIQKQATKKCLAGESRL